jgi:biopolymer transport protein ExbD
MAATFTPTASEAEARPMMDMNTTPLIDVLLVLLIMLIVTIPMQTHVVKIPLPQGRGLFVDRLKDEIAIAPAGAISWNGQVVSQAELAGLLAEVARLPSPPEIHLRPDAQARYETVDQVLAIAKRQRVQLLGFVGNERYANF